MGVKFGALLVAALVVIGSGAGAAQKAPAAAQVAKVEVVNTVQTSEVEKAVQPDPTVAPCVPDDRNSDLCAQWKAADAARDGANWSLVTLIISGLTLIAVVAGFWQNRILQRQEYRAYLKFVPDETTVSITNGEISMSVKVLNYGRTPAKNVRISYDVGKPGDQGILSIITPTIRTDAGFVIHPGSEGGNIPIVAPGNYDWDDLLIFHSAVSVICRVEYNDVFGDEHVTRLGFDITPEGHNLDRKYGIQMVPSSCHAT